jgi:hypothetical protein
MWPAILGIDIIGSTLPGHPWRKTSGLLPPSYFPLPIRRAFFNVESRVSTAACVRPNWWAIKALSSFASDNAKSRESSAGVHGWPREGGASLILPSPSIRSRPGAGWPRSGSAGLPAELPSGRPCPRIHRTAGSCAKDLGRLRAGLRQPAFRRPFFVLHFSHLSNTLFRLAKQAARQGGSKHQDGPLRISASPCYTWITRMVSA